MLNDNAVIEGASDIVADNVTTLPASTTVNSLVYLTQVDRTFQPGLYIFTEANVWILLSNGEVVS